jgi:hypothetical protein
VGQWTLVACGSFFPLEHTNLRLLNLTYIGIQYNINFKKKGSKNRKPDSLTPEYPAYDPVL